MFMWAAVVGLIGTPPVWVMCFFAWLGANGQTFLNTTNVVTGLRNFPEYSGTIVGIMKGFLGLSGAILIQLYHTFCDGDPATYLLMLACLPAFICTLLMFLLINLGAHVNICNPNGSTSTPLRHCHQSSMGGVTKLRANLLV
ncbi:hypothetical protein AAHE18_05G242400 [Arachis hypogaea]